MGWWLGGRGRPVGTGGRSSQLAAGERGERDLTRIFTRTESICRVSDDGRFRFTAVTLGRGTTPPTPPTPPTPSRPVFRAVFPHGRDKRQAHMNGYRADLGWRFNHSRDDDLE